MSLHNIRIEYRSEFGRDTRIWLDGEPLRGVVEVQTKATIQGKTEVTLRMFARINAPSEPDESRGPDAAPALTHTLSTE